MAVNFAKISSNRKFIIFSDSLSSLQALQNGSDNSFVYDILCKLKNLKDSRKHIIFCWVPSHVGISGNEKADKEAKSSLNKIISPRFIPYTDMKQYINQYIVKLWQEQWDNEIHNKLHGIQPIVGQSNPINNIKRREEIILARLRIGHTNLTHLYILTGGNPPICQICHCNLTVKHFMLDCISYNVNRTVYFKNNHTLKDILLNISYMDIFKFLKEIGLYHKL
jgi:ribonuclease HI